MTIILPEDCTTSEDRQGFGFKALDNIERLHRFMGEWFTVGEISEERWQGIPIEMQIAYPYKPQIDKATFEHFRKQYGDPIIDAVCEIIATAENEIKEKSIVSTRWDLDFSNVVM
jgi:hypothetical protein